MSVIYPQISKPGGFGMGLCAGRYSRPALATPTCFCICRLWQNPVCLPPHHHPSAWMYSTSRSSICFCPPMKRSIIICRMHSWRAASSAWANQGSPLNLGHESKRPYPSPKFILIIWALCLRSSVEQVFITTLSPSSLFPYKSFQSEWGLCMPTGWWQAPD